MDGQTTKVPAAEGVHYTSSMPDGYPEPWASATAHTDLDGKDAVIFLEVGIKEGYTLGRLTPNDAETLGKALIVAAADALRLQREARERWYGSV